VPGFWAPDRVWKGRTAFVLGGGPSLRGVTLPAAIAPDTIAVNSSFRLCPAARVLFFHDYAWMAANLAAVEAWPGLVVTVSRLAAQALPERVKRIDALWGRPLGAPPPVRLGRSSGQTAVALAAAMGARRIVLLGFDMRVAAGRSHWHDEYATEAPEFDIFRRAFDGWRAAAETAGIAIVNATPDSALFEFDATTLQAELAHADAG
jgi:hypothetical protein